MEITLQSATGPDASIRSIPETASPMVGELSGNGKGEVAPARQGYRPPVGRHRERDGRGRSQTDKPRMVDIASGTVATLES